MWALGVMLHELLTSAHPFRFDSQSLPAIAREYPPMSGAFCTKPCGSCPIAEAPMPISASAESVV